MHNIGTFSLVKVVFDGVAGNNDGHLFGMVKILKSNLKLSKYRVLQLFYVVDNKLFVLKKSRIESKYIPVLVLSIESSCQDPNPVDYCEALTQ